MGKRRALDADDVLAGRVKPSAVELLDLIHRINPTGRELGAREAEIRYAQKARLQSLLVRRFADEIEVVPDPDHEGTVSLLHRGRGRDGCHAVIATLEDDARAWVQMQIDLGPPSSAAPAARPSGGGLHSPDLDDEDDPTPPALVRRAERAIDAYDYDLARGLLARAVAASDGAAEPAAALLALLVETLGDDAEALALEASLSDAAIAHARVRGLLALAAARSADESRALALVRGTEDRHAATVFGELAAAGLRRGDVERAAAHLDEARRRDPTAPALAGLAAEIAKARAALRRPAEDALQALVAAGRDDEAERKANELLSRWPDSEVARRALRGIEERRRDVEVARLAAAAEAAAAEGDAATALARLGQALAMARGAEREQLERRARAIEAGERARREAAVLERVRSLIGAPDPREGLVAYLDLDDALRARARGTSELLRWIDLARGAPRARVEAVVALGRARERAAADPEAALALLEPHAGVLERVPEARRIAREAEARIAEARAARAIEAVRAAREALAKGGAAEARRLLDEATLRDVPEPEQAAALALRAEAAAVAAREERIAEVARLRAGDHLFEARALAEELAKGSEGEERTRWEEERRAIQQAIQRRFRVEVDEEPRPFHLPDLPIGLGALTDAHRWLTADGHTIIHARAHDHWVIIEAVDRATRVVRTTVALRAPEKVAHLWVEVIEDTVWLASAWGGLLAVTMSTWEVQSFHSNYELRTARRQPASVALASGERAGSPRYFWSALHAVGGGEESARVYDLDQRRLVREIPDVERVAALQGAREPRVACFKEDALVVYEDRGVPLSNGRIAVPSTKPVGVAVHPDGRGMVVLLKTLAPERDGWGLAWVEAPFAGPARAPRLIEGADGGLYTRIASSRENGLVVVIFRNLESTWELLALRATDGALEPLYRVPISGATFFLQDAGAHRLVALESGNDEVAVAELGHAPPGLPAWPLFAGRRIHHVHAVDACMRLTGERKAIVDRYAEDLRKLSRVEVAALIRNYQAGPDVDPAQALLTALALAELGPTRETYAQRLRAWLWERFPQRIDVRLYRANALAREGRWPEVQSLLAEAGDRGDDASPPAHHYHLLALAALHAGDVDGARRMADEARDHERPCVLDALVELLTPLPDSLKPEAPGRELPALARLVAAVHAADRCLERGDAAGALALVDAEPFAAGDNVQLAARRVEALLRVPPQSRWDRFRRIALLGEFLDVHEEERVERRQEIPIPGATWDRARLDEVAARARAWLDLETESTTTTVPSASAFPTVEDAPHREGRDDARDGQTPR